MKKRAYLIHGWEGYPEEGWLPWLKKELEDRGFEVSVPAMPNTNFPIQKEWVSHLQKLVGKPTQNYFFVGHSLGCITILRILEGLEEGEKVGGAVLVAGFTDDLGFKEIATFFKDKIDFKKIRKACPKFVAIHSDNDPWADLKYGDILKEKLGAKLIVEHNKKHFSGDDNIFELPSALEAVLELAK